MIEVNGRKYTAQELIDAFKPEIEKPSNRDDASPRPAANPELVEPVRSALKTPVIPRDRGHWIGTLGALFDGLGDDAHAVAAEWCEIDAVAEAIEGFDDNGLDYAWGYLKSDPRKKVRTLKSIFYDARQAGWSVPAALDFADIFEAEAEQPGGPDAEQPKPWVLVKSATEMTLEGVLEYERDPLVEGIFLRRGEQATLHAETTHGKTFLGIDLGFHLALPNLTQWHDRDIARVPVLYVPLEDVPGFEKRVVAAKMEFGDPGDWFMRIVPDLTLNSTDAGKQGVETIIAAAAAQRRRCGDVPTGFIIIDTKARATAGDNDDKTQDATRYIEQRIGKIIKATGATVLTMSHPNRAGDERGSLVSKQADDVRLTVTRKNGKRTLVVEKVRNGEGGRALFDYSLKIYELGRNAKGKAMTSCTLVKSEPSAVGKGDRSQQPKRGPVTLDAAFRELQQTGKCVTDLMPVAQVPGIRANTDDVRTAFLSLYGGTAKTSDDTKKRAWTRIKNALPPGFELSADELHLWQADAPFGVEEDAQ